MELSQPLLDSERIFRNLKQVVAALVENFSCDEEKKTIVFQVSGEPFETNYKLTVHSQEQLLTVYSKLPFTVEEPYREAYATAVCRLNYDRMFGATFDFSPEKGFTVYRIPILYKKSLISVELLETVIRDTQDTVSRYISYLYDIAHGVAAELPS
ncbi:MAG: hypothetical protein J5532_06720 [Lachnospiraceae bacterium]|nr:hypothetical protein [Lachnospiraceae bacterium]